MRKRAIIFLLLLSLLLSSCVTPYARTSDPAEYWGIIPLSFKQVVSDPSIYSTEKGRTMMIKYEKNLENIFLNVRKTYKVSEIEFAPYVPHKSAGLSFMKPNESKTDERFVALTVVSPFAFFDKWQSTYSDRAAAISTKYIRGLIEITLQETQVIDDPDIAGILIFIAWSTIDVKAVKRGEGFILMAAQEDCKSFTSNTFTLQDFANRATIKGIQEGKDLGTVSLTVGPTTMKIFDTIDKESLALALYETGTELIADGKPQVAISFFDRVIEIDPKYSKAYYFRGSAYASLSMHNAAVKDVEKSIQTAPKDSLEQYMRAGLSALKNNPKESCKFLKVAINNGLRRDIVKLDANFDSIRNAACYKEIMAGH